MMYEPCKRYVRNMRLTVGISFLFIIACFLVFGQNEFKLKLPQVHVHKSGPYIGIQRGAFSSVELGAEFQWKKIQLMTALSNGIYVGCNYNFASNTLGYATGYWIKPSRLGLTYGGNILYFTDFKHRNLAFAPSVGYKLMGFHATAGYQILSMKGTPTGVNSLYVCLRFVLINQRDTKIKR